MPPIPLYRFTLSLVFHASSYIYTQTLVLLVCNAPRQYRNRNKFSLDSWFSTGKSNIQSKVRSSKMYMGGILHGTTRDFRCSWLRLFMWTYRIHGNLWDHGSNSWNFLPIKLPAARAYVLPEWPPWKWFQYYL